MKAHRAIPTPSVPFSNGTEQVLADTAWWDPENENDERARRVYADVAIHTTRETP